MINLRFECGDCAGDLVWNFTDGLWHCFGCGDGGSFDKLAKKAVAGSWVDLKLKTPERLASSPQRAGSPCPMCGQDLYAGEEGCDYCILREDRDQLRTLADDLILQVERLRSLHQHRATDHAEETRLRDFAAAAWSELERKRYLAAQRFLESGLAGAPEVPEEGPEQ